MIPHRTVRGRLRRAARLSVCACALLGGPGIAAFPAAAQEAASAVQDVVLVDVTLPLGDTVFKAPRITVSGTRLSRGDLTAILKADSPEPWAPRLARLEAASITIPVLVSEHAGPGGSLQTVTYREITARDVRAGRIAELTVAGAGITVTGGAQTGSGTYGRISATDLDLAALFRLASEPGDGKGPVQRVYASIQAADVTYTEDSGITVRIARLDGRDFGGRQVPGGWNGAMSALTDGLGAANREMTARARGKLAASAADLADAVSFGNLDLHGLAVSRTGAGTPMLIEVGRLAHTGTGTETGTTLEAITFAQGGLKAQLGRLALTGVSLSPTIATLRRLANPETAATDAELRRLAPVVAGVAMQDLSVELPPDPAAGTSGREPGKPPIAAKPRDPLAAPASSAAPVRIALRSGTLTFGPPRDGIVSASRLDLSGLTFPAAAVARTPMLGALRDYGYADLDLNLVIDSAWDEAKREVTLREMTLSGRDIGSLRLAGTVGGMGPELFTSPVPATSLLMLSATAKALDVTIQNSGLFERFLAAQSKNLSLKPEELRQEYVAASQFGVPAMLGNSPAAQTIGAAVSQFVTKPGRLTVTARAKNAGGLGFVDFGTARTPAAILDKLDVNAKAE